MLLAAGAPAALLLGVLLPQYWYLGLVWVPLALTLIALDALLAARAPVVAVSPIVGGEALRGPAAQMMRSLGGVPSATGIAAHYAQRYPRLLDVLFIDESDEAAAPDIDSLGIQSEIAQIVIPDEASRVSLAERVLTLARGARLEQRSGPSPKAEPAPLEL
jgi:LPPG:FO 2-phospho-L-lactate transferase